MKKLFLIFAAATLLLVGCSGDDSGSNASVKSHIRIDGEKFTPSPNSDADPTLVTYITEGLNNGQVNRRGFHLTKQASGNEPGERLTLYVDYPSSRPNADGSYIFELVEPGQLFARGTYTIGNVEYGFSEGTVIIDEKQDGRFRITFDNVGAVSISRPGIHITGYYESKFTDQWAN